MELEIWGNTLKYENGEIWNYRKHRKSKEPKWYTIDFTEHRIFCKKEQKWKIYYYCKMTHPETKIKRMFKKHRLVYKFHNPEWDILDNTQYNNIDHIDGMSNDISNLRIVTQQKNTFNTNAKGCYLFKNKWLSYIVINGKKINLGCFNTEEEARNAYLEAKKKYHII